MQTPTTLTLTLPPNFSGDIAADARTTFLAALTAGTLHFRLNCAAVQTMDSVGLGVLVTLQKRALQENGSLHLEQLSPSVQRLLERTRLMTAFCPLHRKAA